MCSYITCWVHILPAEPSVPAEQPGWELLSAPLLEVSSSLIHSHWSEESLLKGKEAVHYIMSPVVNYLMKMPPFPKCCFFNITSTRDNYPLQKSNSPSATSCYFMFKLLPVTVTTMYWGVLWGFPDWVGELWISAVTYWVWDGWVCVADWGWPPAEGFWFVMGEPLSGGAAWPVGVTTVGVTTVVWISARNCGVVEGVELVSGCPGVTVTPAPWGWTAGWMSPT